MDREYIKQQLEKMTTEQLVKELSYGEDSFQDGIYSLYLNEASRRGISQTILPDRISEAKGQNVQDNGNNLFKMGVVFLFIFVLGGIPSFVIGILLNKKNTDGSYMYNAEIRNKSKLLLILPAVLWVIFFVMMILLALLYVIL